MVRKHTRKMRVTPWCIDCATFHELGEHTSPFPRYAV